MKPSKRSDHYVEVRAAKAREAKARQASAADRPLRDLSPRERQRVQAKIELESAERLRDWARNGFMGAVSGFALEPQSDRYWEEVERHAMNLRQADAAYIAASNAWHASLGR